MNDVTHPARPTLRKNIWEEHEVWPDPRVIAVGRSFKRARLMAGLSQQQLAVRAGISQSVISRFERGLAPGMRTERLIVLADAVGWRFPLGHCPHDHDCNWKRIEPINYDHPPARRQSFKLPVLRKSKRRRHNDIAQRLLRAGAWGPGIHMRTREFAQLKARITREVDDERAGSA